MPEQRTISTAEQAKADIPEWVKETPEPQEALDIQRYYELACIDSHSRTEDLTRLQDVDLTREEFIFLKQQLAAKRGYELPAGAEDWDMQDIRAKRLSQEFLASLLVTHGLDAREAAYLAVCQRIIRADHGANSPAEEFFVHLLDIFEFHAPTPEDIERCLATFRENLEDAVSDAKRIAADYPELIKAAGAGK